MNVNIDALPSRSPHVSVDEACAALRSCRATVPHGTVTLLYSDGGGGKGYTTTILREWPELKAESSH